MRQALGQLEEDRRQLEEYQALARGVERFDQRYRIYAGGGFVEEYQSGLVEHGATECKALLPSPGKLRGEAMEIRAETV